MRKIPSDDEVKAAVKTIANHCITTRDCNKCKFFKTNGTITGTYCKLRKNEPYLWAVTL